MYIEKIISKWKYLGYDKKTIDKYYREINIDNFLILGYTGLVLGTASIIGLILLLTLKMDKLKIYTVILFFVCTLYIVLKYKVFRKKENNIKCCKINFIINLYSYIACIFAIYIGVFLSKDSEAVTIIWLFLFLVVIFNRLPMQNLSLIPVMVLLIVTSFKVKGYQLALYDTVHSIVVIAVAMFMSWSKSKIKLDSIIVRHELKAKNKELSYLNAIDTLTNLYNRKSIFRKFTKIKNECINENKKLCCIVMDIDNFKKYNDTYGHPAGDKLLMKVGNVLKDCSINKNIYIGRIGGEEFMAVWKEKRKESPEDIAEEIRKSVYDLKIPHETSDVAEFATISIGLFVSLGERLHNIDPYSLADLALYDAKKLGKNRTFVAKDESSVQIKSINL